MNKSRKLKLDKNYMPIPTNVGDEIYPNGIFDFNISKMLEHITARKLDAKKELINVSEWFIKAVSHIVRQVNRVTIYKEPQYRIEWSENQVDFEEEYRNYRRRQVGLHKIILKEFVSANDYLKAAALLGILNTNNEVVIESKSEEDALYDFNIYGNIRAGSSALSEYMEKYPPENSEDEELLSAMKRSDVKLYEVAGNKEDGFIILKDPFHQTESIKLIDISMGENLNPNILLFTRLIHLNEFSMTSGLTLAFSKNHIDHLTQKSRKMIKKIQSGDDSVDRFIAFFNLNRLNGLPVLLEKVK